MSLDAEFQAFIKKPNRCSVCNWLNTQDAETRDFFDRNAAANVARMTTFAKERFDLPCEVTAVRRHVRENHTP